MDNDCHKQTWKIVLLLLNYAGRSWIRMWTSFSASFYLQNVASRCKVLWARTTARCGFPTPRISLSGTVELSNDGLVCNLQSQNNGTLIHVYSTVTVDGYIKLVRYHLFPKLHSKPSDMVFWTGSGFSSLLNSDQTIIGHVDSEHVDGERWTDFVACTASWVNSSGFKSSGILKISSNLRGTAEHFWAQHKNSSYYCEYYRRNTSK